MFAGGACRVAEIVDHLDRPHGFTIRHVGRVPDPGFLALGAVRPGLDERAIRPAAAIVLHACDGRVRAVDGGLLPARPQQRAAQRERCGHDDDVERVALQGAGFIGSTAVLTADRAGQVVARYVDEFVLFVQAFEIHVHVIGRKAGHLHEKREVVRGELLRYDIDVESLRTGGQVREYETGPGLARRNMAADGIRIEPPFHFGPRVVAVAAPIHPGHFVRRKIRGVDAGNGQSHLAGVVVRDFDPDRLDALLVKRQTGKGFRLGGVRYRDRNGHRAFLLGHSTFEKACGLRLLCEKRLAAAAGQGQVQACGRQEAGERSWTRRPVSRAYDISPYDIPPMTFAQGFVGIWQAQDSLLLSACSVPD